MNQQNELKIIIKKKSGKTQQLSQLLVSCLKPFLWWKQTVRHSLEVSLHGSRSDGFWAVCRRTCADDAGILFVSAVMDRDTSVGALPQVVLVPSALHVIQEDVPGAWAKLGFRHSQQSFSAPQAPAHHLGVPQPPAVVADRSPAAVVVKFDAAPASAVTVCQS